MWGMWKWLTLWCCVWAFFVFGITWPGTLLEDDSKKGSDCCLEFLSLLIPWQRSGGGSWEGVLIEHVQTYVMCLLYQDLVTLNCSLLPPFHSGEAGAGLSICSASSFTPLCSFFHHCQEWCFCMPGLITPFSCWASSVAFHRLQDKVLNSYLGQALLLLVGPQPHFWSSPASYITS